MIGGLQGDFGDLDIKDLKKNISKYLKKNISKYLKKNISKCQLHISGSFRRIPRHCAKWLRNSPGKRYQRIRICLSGEVETPSSPIRRQAPDVKYPEKVEQESQPDRIPDMRYPEKMERRKGDRLRVHGVGTHPEQLHLDSPRGHTVCSPIRTPLGRSTRHSRSSHPDDSISYPDMALVIIIPYSLHSGFAYGKGLQSFGSSCF